jgi:hypothetical protein
VEQQVVVVEENKEEFKVEEIKELPQIKEESKH